MQPFTVIETWRQNGAWWNTHETFVRASDAVRYASTSLAGRAVVMAENGRVIYDVSHDEKEACE